MTVGSAPSSLISRDRLALSTAYAAPEGDLERLIASTFAEVFTLDRVGAEDAFFDLGGDSLLAELLSTLISERTGYDFPISSLNDHGSPRRIASLIDNSANGGASDAIAQDAPIRPPIFVVHGRGGYTMPQPQFFRALAEGQKLRMFELPGIRGGRSYHRIEDIAEVYTGQITSEYPQGPVLLASFCAGGLIALEMAARLAKNGRPTKHLVLIDPPIRKNGTLGYGPSPFHWDLVYRTKRLLQRLLPRTWRLRYYDLKWNRPFAAKYSVQGLSGEAQVNLYAAFREYRPRPHAGPVTILGSSRRLPRLTDESHAAQILPNRATHLVFEQHKEVTSNPRTAELLQATFDAALSEG